MNTDTKKWLNKCSRLFLVIYEIEMAQSTLPSHNEDRGGRIFVTGQIQDNPRCQEEIKRLASYTGQAYWYRGSAI